MARVSFTLLLDLCIDTLSNICRDIQKIEGLIREYIPIPQKIYPITKRLKTPAEKVEKYFPGLMAFIDCTEQQIPRPVNKERRKMYYSGKNKRHTVKNQLTVNNHRGYIIHKANHKKGNRHDYNIQYIRGIVMLFQNKLLMCLTLDILA